MTLTPPPRTSPSATLVLTGVHDLADVLAARFVSHRLSLRGGVLCFGKTTLAVPFFTDGGAGRRTRAAQENLRTRTRAGYQRVAKKKSLPDHVLIERGEIKKTSGYDLGRLFCWLVDPGMTVIITGEKGTDPA